VKIASQRLPAFPPLKPCALRALCCEFLRPFRIITLRIAFPVTPLFSQPSALPGGVTLCGLRGPNSVLSVLCFFFQLFCCQSIAASCLSLCPLFRPPALCFQSFPASFPKIPRVGGTPSKWDSHFSLPAAGGAVLRRSPNNPPSQPNGGPMTPTPALPSNPSLEHLNLPLRTSNPCSPKWSIIPAPASATRLRGRSV
jgi:hypothetical protein